MRPEKSSELRMALGALMQSPLTKKERYEENKHLANSYTRSQELCWCNISFNPRINLQGRYYYPVFIDEEMAWERPVLCPSHKARGRINIQTRTTLTPHATSNSKDRFRGLRVSVVKSTRSLCTGTGPARPLPASLHTVLILHLPQQASAAADSFSQI